MQAQVKPLKLILNVIPPYIDGTLSVSEVVRGKHEYRGSSIEKPDTEDFYRAMLELPELVVIAARLKLQYEQGCYNFFKAIQGYPIYSEYSRWGRGCEMCIVYQILPECTAVEYKLRNEKFRKVVEECSHLSEHYPDSVIYKWIKKYWYFRR